MIEENVVSSAGATTRFDREAMQATIRRAGFRPQLRDQLYNYRELKF
jgi:cyclic dehypoxanthinyl futalosine synthase